MGALWGVSGLQLAAGRKQRSFVAVCVALCCFVLHCFVLHSFGLHSFGLHSIALDWPPRLRLGSQLKLGQKSK